MHDRLFLEAVGKTSVLGEKLLPLRELRRSGQLAEEQQVGAFLEPEAPLAFTGAHEVDHVDAPVEELAGNGLLLPFRDDVAVDVADGRQAHQHARAVRVAKPALHVVLLVQRGVDRVHAPHVVGARLQPNRINHLPFSTLLVTN